MMAYESPIKIINKIQDAVIEQQETNTVKAILSYGISIDKDELHRLLTNDRNQYKKGYHDGYNDCISKCKDIIFKLRDKCGNDEMAFALNWAARLINEQKENTETDGAE